jgi:enediyne biosynthesis protein E4
LWLRIELCRMKIVNTLLILLYGVLLFTCSTDTQNKKYQFTLLKKNSTGLDFENVLKQSEAFNVFNYMYFFNGGGLAAGDFNKDGKVDLFFTSNMGENKLFINEGNLKFKDVTKQAHMEGADGWTSGASVVDINNDGLLDIYVSQIGDFGIIKGRNQLYVCARIDNGVPVFEEQAVQYGLDLVGFGTQASFCDYDMDGDLDMFQLNHSVHENGTYLERSVFENTTHPTAGDKLMRNDDGKFVDVTQAAGVLATAVGYGLGIATSDVNLDGWPDIYIGNDFHENDYLYINQKNGTFKETLNDAMKHTSKFSMGIDAADINNDGYSDIISLDMLPYDPYILKNSMGDDTYSVFQFKLTYGYNQQYARNNLQLNNGDGTFSEIGTYAGINATDWSWSSLFLDFDHDGYKDLVISNGIPRRMNDLDYINYLQNHEEIKWRAAMKTVKKEELAVIDSMPKIKLPNKFFRNTADLKFKEIENEIDGDLPTYSNGTIYADLDNDGDLDIVVNNIEDEPFVYKNLTIENSTGDKNYVALHLTGSAKNINAIGAKAIAFKGKERIVCENFPVRGFQSSMLSTMHLGIGDTAKIDSIILIWPDRSYERLKFKFNTINQFTWRSGLPKINYENVKAQKHDVEFKDVTNETNLNLTHKENVEFIEFNREPLMPYMVSREGPAIAVGDLNADGLDDVFFGSSKWKQSTVYFQDASGQFHAQTNSVIASDSTFEDVDAAIVDVENDGDNDIVVAAGGNEFWGKSEYLKQRVYVNDGKGNFTRQFISEEVFLTASCVLPTDVNGDGLIDLFFGARAVPNNFGKIPESFLFLNKGNGKFENVTSKYSDDLRFVGMVNDGAWTDLDKDGDQDLIIAADWQPLKIFYNESGHFKMKIINEKRGWWNFILPHDFDGDGDIDFVAGNLGENAKLKPTQEEPVKMYVNDFDGNGQTEQIMTYYVGHKEIPFASFMEITKQIPSIKKKYLYTKQFAKAALGNIFSKDQLENADVFTADYFTSVYIENKNGKFVMQPLPARLQFSPLKAAAIARDGRVLIGGNFFECAIEIGRFDASDGNLLSINSDRMDVSPIGDLKINGQVKAIVPIQIKGKINYVVVRNNQPAIIVSENDQPKILAQK